MAHFAPKSILCPLDLSSASPQVLRWAALLANLYRAKLQILHAEWAEYPLYFLPSYIEELSAAAGKTREIIRGNLKSLLKENLPTTTPYEIAILEGHPVETILKYSEQHNPDLIVMGSHGRSGLARMRLGSVAENVVQQTSTPTLVVRAPGGKPVPSRISRILCPVTLEKHATESVSLSAVLAATSAAQLIIVHAEKEIRTPDAYPRQLCDVVPTDIRDHCELIELIRKGSAAEQILLVAREHSVDIITLAAKHRRFLDFTVIGNTTEMVMRHADSAVLIVPITGGAI